MIDRQTNERVVVGSTDDAVPYIIIGIDQKDELESLLKDNGYEYKVDVDAIRIDKKPVSSVFNLCKETNIEELQALLDSHKGIVEKDKNTYAESLSNVALKTLAKAAADLVITPSPVSLLLSLFSSTERTRRKTIEERKTALVKDLIESGIDPVVFDSILSNENDRKLKLQFGIIFLVFTFIFTAASYSIVMLDGIYDWKISEIAITALIIETPIQFIGLLYIIARNLFPQRETNKQSAGPSSSISSTVGLKRDKKEANQ